MSILLCEDRCIHTSRSAADYHNFLLDAGRLDSLAPCFPTQNRVNGAGKAKWGIESSHPFITAVEALDTGPDIFPPARSGLVGKLGVSDLGAGNGNGVCFAAGQNVFHHLRLHNGRDRNYRQFDSGFFESFSQVDMGGRRHKAEGFVVFAGSRIASGA